MARTMRTAVLVTTRDPAWNDRLSYASDTAICLEKNRARNHTLYDIISAAAALAVVVYPESD